MTRTFHLQNTSANLLHHRFRAQATATTVEGAARVGATVGVKVAAATTVLGAARVGATVGVKEAAVVVTAPLERQPTQTATVGSVSLLSFT